MSKTATSVVALLKKHNIRAKKAFGQNFLVDLNLIDKMIDSLEIYPDEVVLEIGPGPGFITSRLAKQSLHVVAVEKDSNMIAIAKKEFGKQSNMEFVEADFLKVDLYKLLNRFPLPVKVFGNIPYYISSQIIFKLLENKTLWNIAMLTMQKEVASRLVSPPGSKEYGILSIMVQSQVNVRKLCDLDGGCFIPPPDVTSTSVIFEVPENPPHKIHNYKVFQKVVKTAFNQRRKTLSNTLKTLIPKNEKDFWEKTGIDPQMRPETLSVAQYVVLANALNTCL